jgi:MFS family permease
MNVAISDALPRASVRLVALLTLAMFINYVDRGSLSVVAPLLKDKLAINNAEMGLLLSAFFWSYAFSQPFAGTLVHRFDVRLMLAAGVALWAAATMFSGLANSFAVLFGLRLLLGIGESVIYPANARILACIPAHLRGRANGFIASGMMLGPSVGTLAGGLVLATWGWRAVFLGLGALSLLWLWPWLTMTRGADAIPREPQGVAGPAYPEILRQRSLWGASVGHFCLNYQFYMLLTWLPLLLVKFEHFSLTAMAWGGAAIYAGHALAAVSSGLASDALIRRGASSSNVRKSFMLAGVAGGGVMLTLACLVPAQWVAPILVVNGLFGGLTSPMIYTIGQTLSGPSAGGRWMGIQNFIGNLAGIVAPIITGLVIDATGSFQNAFLIAAGLSVVGLFSWGVVIERVEPVTWRLGSLVPAKA